MTCFCAAVATCFADVTAWAAPLLWLTAWLFAGVCLWNAARNVAAARNLQMFSAFPIIGLELKLSDILLATALIPFYTCNALQTGKFP